MQNFTQHSQNLWMFPSSAIMSNLVEELETQGTSVYMSIYLSISLLRTSKFLLCSYSERDCRWHRIQAVWTSTPSVNRTVRGCNVSTDTVSYLLEGKPPHGRKVICLISCVFCTTCLPQCLAHRIHTLFLNWKISDYMDRLVSIYQVWMHHSIKVKIYKIYISKGVTLDKLFCL